LFFKGTLQVKYKKPKNKKDKENNRALKLRKRAKHFYDIINDDPDIKDSLPTFDSFNDKFIETKGALDVERAECYSWSEVLDILVDEFKLPDISKYYEHFFDEKPAPLYGLLLRFHFFFFFKKLI